MVVLALMLAVVSVLIVAACVQHARTRGWSAPGLRSLRRERPRPTQPPEDQPPAGLPPLIPSPRALASEFERGLREITLFLAVQAPD